MGRYGTGRAAKPLDGERLRDLALHYVGRFATTRGKLADYLRRKVGERGWADDASPPIEKIVEDLAALGYVDDAGFAEARSRTLQARGYGPRRIATALKVAKVEDHDVQPVLPHEDAALAAAERYARRKRLGPYGAVVLDPVGRRKQIAAMARAGHSFDVIRQVLGRDSDPNQEI